MILKGKLIFLNYYKKLKNSLDYLKLMEDLDIFIIVKINKLYFITNKYFSLFINIAKGFFSNIVIFKYQDIFLRQSFRYNYSALAFLILIF